MKISVAALISALLLSVCLAFGQERPSATQTGGVSTPAKNTNPSGPQFAQRYPRYQITTGDTMDLTFSFSPEFNQSVAVQPDGFISLKGLGDLHISGMTVPEATTALAKAYSKILKDPEVSLVLKDFDKPSFIVTGQVLRPGKYDLHGDMTLLQGLSVAGGFTPSSKNSQVVLFRQVSSEWSEAKVLDVKQMLKSKQLAEDLHLRPGDMIYVPQNRLSKIRPFIPNSALATQINPAQF